MTEKKLQIIPLGGLGEFGMNMSAIRYGEDIIVVDCGMMFPEAELLGVDLVMPDLNGLQLYGQAIHRCPELAARFVFMTGASADVAACLHHLPNTFIEKPVDAATFDAHIRTACRSRDAEIARAKGSAAEREGVSEDVEPEGEVQGPSRADRRDVAPASGQRAELRADGFRIEEPLSGESFYAQPVAHEWRGAFFE